MSVVEELKNAAAQAEENFHTLVQRIAVGEEVTPSAAKKVLEAAGRSPDTLEKAVVRARQVAELRAKITEQETIRREAEVKLGPAMEVLQEKNKMRDEAVLAAQVAANAWQNHHSEMSFAHQRISTLQAELRQVEAPPIPKPARPAESLTAAEVASRFEPMTFRPSKG